MNKEISKEQNVVLSNDPYTLRVRGGDVNDPNEKKRPTDPHGLAKSILHVLSQGEGYVNLKSVGRTAESIAMHSFRIASLEVYKRTKGSALVCVQSEYEAEIAGKVARGICTRIFTIPARDLL